MSKRSKVVKTKQDSVKQIIKLLSTLSASGVAEIKRDINEERKQELACIKDREEHAIAEFHSELEGAIAAFKKDPSPDMLHAVLTDLEYLQSAVEVGSKPVFKAFLQPLNVEKSSTVHKECPRCSCDKNKVHG